MLAETGAPARLSPMFGTADARYFADRQIPAVYYGPAGGDMHAPDEWVNLDSARRVARVLARTIVDGAVDLATIMSAAVLSPGSA